MIIPESTIKIPPKFKTRNEYLRRIGVMEPVKYVDGVDKAWELA